MAQLAGSDEDGHADETMKSQPVPIAPRSVPIAPQSAKATQTGAAIASHRKPETGGTSSGVDAVSISLRRAYESTLHEEIPDAFLDLLRKLD